MGRIAFFIIGATLASTLAFAEITGGNALYSIFARLDVSNIFTASQEIQTDGTDPRTGLNLTKDGSERVATCLSRDPANGGTPRSFCYEATSFQSFLVGSSANIFETATSPTTFMSMDFNGGGRVNIAPTGVLAVASGSTGAVAATEFMVGGSAINTAQFNVDATNGWVQILPNPSIDFNPVTGDCIPADPSTQGIIAFDSLGQTPYICTDSGFRPLIYTPMGNTDEARENVSLVTSAGGGTVLFDGIGQFFWAGTGGGNALGYIPLVSPASGEIVVSCQLMGGAGTFQRTYAAVGAPNFIYTAGGLGIQPCEIVTCDIRGTTDMNYFKYTQTWNHTCDSATSSSQYMTLKSRLSFGN